MALYANNNAISLSHPHSVEYESISPKFMWILKTNFRGGVSNVYNYVFIKDGVWYHLLLYIL